MNDTQENDTSYCWSCGEEIVSHAAICPHCGVQQTTEDSTVQNNSSGFASELRKHELQKKSEKDTLLAVILGLLLGPLGYAYMEEWGWAIICFFTLNYFFFGIIIVPFHCFAMIENAETELNKMEMES